MMFGVLVGAATSKDRERSPSTSHVANALLPEEATTGIARAAAATGMTEEEKTELRRIVREEVRAAQSAQAREEATDSGRPLPPEATSPAMSDDAIHAYDRAQGVIDDALARGSWTADDRSRFRANLAALPAERQVELERAVVIALNKRKMQFAAGHGPPF